MFEIYVYKIFFLDSLFRSWGIRSILLKISVCLDNCKVFFMILICLLLVFLDVREKLDKMLLKLKIKL